MVLSFHNIYFLQMASHSQNEDKPMGLRRHHLDDALFSKVASNMGLTLTSWTIVPIADGMSIFNKLTETKGKDEEIIGHVAVDITGIPFGTGSDEKITKNVVLRAKKEGKYLREDITATIKSNVSAELAEEIQNAFAFLDNSKNRDVHIAKAALTHPVLQAVMPKVVYVHVEEDNDVKFFVMERFSSKECSHIECIEGGQTYGIDSWTNEAIHQVLSGMASFHAKYLGRIDTLPKELVSFLMNRYSLLVKAHRFIEMVNPFYEKRIGDIVGVQNLERIYKVTANLDFIADQMKEHPLTLVHIDCSATNLCLRRNPNMEEKHLCLYDWELAAIHIPHRDFTIFLISILSEDDAYDMLRKYAEVYRECLKRELNNCGYDTVFINQVTYKDGFMSMVDFTVMELLSFGVSRAIVFELILGTEMSFLSRMVKVGYAYFKQIVDRYDFLQ